MDAYKNSGRLIEQIVSVPEERSSRRNVAGVHRRKVAQLDELHSVRRFCIINAAVYVQKSVAPVEIIIRAPALSKRGRCRIRLTSARAQRTVLPEHIQHIRALVRFQPVIWVIEVQTPGKLREVYNVLTLRCR